MYYFFIFAASYLQILFNGPRRVWGCGGEKVKREVYSNSKN